MSEEHSHSHFEVGAASDIHEHYVGEVNGAAHQEDLAKLSRRIDEMAAQVQDLQRKLAAEQEIVAFIRKGCITLPAIIAALRNRAAELTRNIPNSTVECDRHLARELELLADAIEVK